MATTNAMNYIAAADPAFFIQHGSADCNMPPVQGQNLADALGADRATYMLLDGAGHGGEQFATPENLQLVVDFLNQNLKQLLRSRGCCRTNLVALENQIYPAMPELGSITLNRGYQR
jgi:hypothetical protein